MHKEGLSLPEDWKVLASLLPRGWREKAKELKAYQRVRRFKSPDHLLRTLLIHIGEGCSLRETAVRVKEGGIADVSDPAILKRVRLASDWLQWMAAGVMRNWLVKGSPNSPDRINRVRLIDGSTIQEPGSKGTSWRLHYSIGLSSLQCDEVRVTGPETGESFCRFAVEPGDLMLGDRGYAHKRGVHHVVSRGGDVLVRISPTSMTFEDSTGKKFDILEHLRGLKSRHVEDWPVVISYQGSQIMGRICAVRKSQSAAEKARKRIIKDNKRKGRTTRPQTLEAACYTFVFTTLDKSISAEIILSIYRARWQVELAFKRLKSLLGMGRLHMMQPESVKAWIHGKLLLAFLVEALAETARLFPWGYPHHTETGEHTLPLEGNTAHAPFSPSGCESSQPTAFTSKSMERVGK